VVPNLLSAGPIRRAESPKRARRYVMRRCLSAGASLKSEWDFPIAAIRGSRARQPVRFITRDSTPRSTSRGIKPSPSVISQRRWDAYVPGPRNTRSLPNIISWNFFTLFRASLAARSSRADYRVPITACTFNRATRARSSVGSFGELEKRQ
jgi:hypothetical protein